MRREIRRYRQGAIDRLLVFHCSREAEIRMQSTVRRGKGCADSDIFSSSLCWHCKSPTTTPHDRHSPLMHLDKMWIAGKAISYLQRASSATTSQHQGGRPPAVSQTVQQVTDTETSCSSTSASRRDSVDTHSEQAGALSRAGLDTGINRKDDDEDPYDEKVQGYRITEYPALRGSFALSRLIVSCLLTSSRNRRLLS